LNKDEIKLTKPKGGHGPFWNGERNFFKDKVIKLLEIEPKLVAIFDCIRKYYSTIIEVQFSVQNCEGNRDFIFTNMFTSFNTPQQCVDYPHHVFKGNHGFISTFLFQFLKKTL
jgi:site-specific DNA-adenine methylase